MSEQESINQFEDLDTLEDSEAYFAELDLIGAIEHKLQVKLGYEDIKSFI